MMSQNNVSEIDPSVRLFRCIVVSTFPEKGYFFATYGGEKAFCHIKDGRTIVPGRRYPEFRRGEVSMPKRLDKVVAIVTQDNSGRWRAVRWGSYDELRSAKDFLLDSQRMKIEASSSQKAGGENKRTQRLYPSIKGTMILHEDPLLKKAV